MATFDPRRLLMFAVRVLEPHREKWVVSKRAVQDSRAKERSEEAIQ